jgi:nucleotide-binding universal stress UspA family protein
MPHVTRLHDRDAPLSPVVAAISFDEQGRNCLRQALRLAARRGRPVIALHVLNETPRTLGFYRLHDDGEVLRPIADVAESLLAGFSAEVIADQPDWVHVTLRQLVVSGVPDRRVVEVAGLAGAELVVVGGRRKSALQRLLGRDVTGAVLRYAPCPVVVVDDDGSHLRPPEQGGRRGQPLPTVAETS